jgi:hypothetical protein
MIAARNSRRVSSAWRQRIGAAGIVAAATLALAPATVPLTAPVTVHAMELQELAPCDFITSGGFVVNTINSVSKKANFGVHGGCKNGDFWGHLNFVDHATGFHVQSIAITGYVVAPGGNQNARDVCGIAQTNREGDPETINFVARLIDNGEPGGSDQFGLKLDTSDLYSMPPAGSASPVLNLGTTRPGGNVQLHRVNNSTAEWPPTIFGTCAITFDGGGDTAAS